VTFVVSSVLSGRLFTSSAIWPKPKEERRRVSSDTEDIFERVDTGVGGLNNIQALFPALTLGGHEWGQSSTQIISQRKLQ